MINSQNPKNELKSLVFALVLPIAIYFSLFLILKSLKVVETGVGAYGVNSLLIISLIISRIKKNIGIGFLILINFLGTAILIIIGKIIE